jgi:2-oxoglutarate dehydrogenase E2 component (dihydrolipoamide succinyltransferase)
MAIQVIMPQLGESVEEGTITRWLKAPGDAVEEFDPLVEVNTDKVDTEIPSPASGILLEILAPEGKIVKAGDMIARIGEPDEERNSPKISPDSSAQIQVENIPAPTSEAKPESDIAFSTDSSQGRKRDLGFISPVVARLASENKIDLYEVKGTGLDGRITKKDVLTYLEQRATQTNVVEPAQQAVKEARTAKPAPQSRTVSEIAQPLPGDIIPLNNIRK